MVQVFHPDDLLKLLSLRRAIFEAINPAFFNWPEDVFRKELQSSQVWVSKHPITKEINAFLCFREEWDRLEIMVLGTSPKSQKNGLMLEIITELQAFAAQQGKAIGLEVHENNEPAKRLYSKLGFQFLFSRKNYYKDGAAAELFLWKSQV